MFGYLQLVELRNNPRYHVVDTEERAPAVSHMQIKMLDRSIVKCGCRGQQRVVVFCQVVEIRGARGLDSELDGPAPVPRCRDYSKVGAASAYMKEMRSAKGQGEGGCFTVAAY